MNNPKMAAVAVAVAVRVIEGGAGARRGGELTLDTRLTACTHHTASSQQPG